VVGKIDITKGNTLGRPLQRLGGPFREDMVVYMGVCVDLGDSRVDGGGEGVKWARRSIQGRYNVYMRMYWKERQI